MRRHAGLAAAAAALLACSGCPGSGRQPAAEQSAKAQPRGGSAFNVLLITIDTLRADHLGAYGYGRATSPAIDALAARGTLFENAFTHWPKTRGSLAIMLTGRRPSQNGYSKSHPGVAGFNATIASILAAAGYDTAAVVDNPNVAREHGYAKGFANYTQTWDDAALTSEWARTRAITDGALRYLQSPRERPFFLWLHYVNPHAPYTPPSPFNSRFADAAAAAGPALPVVASFHGGIPRQWAQPGQNRLGYYVAQYDGEIAAVDSEIGRLLAALHASGGEAHTVVLLTSDHGESLGEHGYYFDHGEDLFQPSLRIPLIVAGPGVPAAQRSQAFVSTLDVMPTLLDAVKVSYPPELGGQSALPWVASLAGARTRLFAGNDRNLSATWTAAHKLVLTPGDARPAFALYDLVRDPAEGRDLASSRNPGTAGTLRAERRELELFLERTGREWSRTRPQLGAKSNVKLGPEACEKLRALGYVVAECE